MIPALLALCALAQDAPPRVLPAETAAERTAAALHGGVVGTPIPAPAPGSAESWQGWFADLEASRAAPAPDPAREARLALFALEQRRSGEAWKHFSRCGAQPGVCAALLPRFLPGVGADAPLDKDGFAGALPDGVLLAPALPPATGDAPRGRIQRREMKLSALHIGKATVSLRVAVEYDGITVEVGHVAGESCKLALVLPCEPGYQLANEYIDWYVQETHGAPLALECKPGEDVHTLYGRIEPQSILGPERVPETLPALAAREGLVFELLPGDSDETLLRAIAASFHAPPLGLQARVWVLGSAPFPGGLRVDLSRPDERARRLSDLCAAIERFVLDAAH
ncbi:MAG: hypothetical protein IPJ19_15185 [Planctomycetes bacterium]|nr:hypothetical protein [Planctomycetota bacterium]